MPRFDKEFFEVARRWTLVEDRKVELEIKFKGPDFLNKEPRMEMKCWAFDRTFCVGFFVKTKTDFLTATQMAEKARKEALERLEILERRYVA